MRNTVLRRALAAGASVAVATVGLTSFAPSATAESESIPFTCQVPILGERSFTLVADTDLPAQVEAGKEVKVSFTGTVTAPDNVRGGATLFGTSVEGTADVASKVGGKDLPVKATVTSTTIPTTANTNLVLPVSGSTTWTPTGSGSQQVTLPSFSATLSFPQASGAPRTLGPITCAAAAGSNTVVDTVEVVAPAVQATETTATTKYKKKQRKVVAKVEVLNEDGSAASGDVKLVLKKGKKKAKATITLNKKGKGKNAFAKVAPGKYKLVAQYKGSEASKKSKGKATVVVK